MVSRQHDEVLPIPAHGLSNCTRQSTTRIFASLHRRSLPLCVTAFRQRRPRQRETPCCPRSISQICWKARRHQGIHAPSQACPKCPSQHLLQGIRSTWRFCHRTREDVRRSKREHHGRPSGSAAGNGKPPPGHFLRGGSGPAGQVPGATARSDMSLFYGWGV